MFISLFVTVFNYLLAWIFGMALFFGQSTGIVCMRPMHLAAVNCGVIGLRKLQRWYQRYRWLKVNIAILCVLINITQISPYTVCSSRHRNNVRMSQKDVRIMRALLEILISNTNDHWLWFQHDLLVLTVIWCPKPLDVNAIKKHRLSDAQD